MTNKVENRLSIFVVLIITIFCIGLYSHIAKRKKRLNINPVYSIGYVYKYKAGIKVTNMIYYKYEYKLKKYSLTHSNHGLKKFNKKYFIVKLDPNEPTNAEIMLDYEIKNVRISLPIDGWKEIPMNLVKINN